MQTAGLARNRGISSCTLAKSQFSGDAPRAGRSGGSRTAYIIHIPVQRHGLRLRWAVTAGAHGWVEKREFQLHHALCRGRGPRGLPGPEAVPAATILPESPRHGDPPGPARDTQWTQLCSRPVSSSSGCTSMTTHLNAWAAGVPATAPAGSLGRITHSAGRVFFFPLGRGFEETMGHWVQAGAGRLPACRRLAWPGWAVPEGGPIKARSPEPLAPRQFL